MKIYNVCHIEPYEGSWGDAYFLKPENAFECAQSKLLTQRSYLLYKLRLSKSNQNGFDLEKVLALSPGESITLWVDNKGKHNSIRIEMIKFEDAES